VQGYRQEKTDERAKAYQVIAHKCNRIKSVIRDEPHVRLAVLRVGFAALGVHRFRDFRLSYYQRARLDDTCTVTKLRSAAAEETPEWYRRYWNVFNDLITRVNWVQAVHLLEENAAVLADAVGELLSPDRAVKKIGNHEAWVWAGSSIGVGDDEIGRNLDRLLASGTPQLTELSRLSAARRACGFSSHVFLVSSIVQDYFLEDLTSPAKIRDQLINAFGPRHDELNEELGEQIESCRNVSADVVTCAKENVSIKGGVTAASLAQAFMGFYIGKSESEIADLLAPRKRQYGKINITQESGPRMIDYAHCALSSTTPWDNIPAGAKLLPAQGSTRSPKGHRT
jgi:hypothetical protein